MRSSTKFWLIVATSLLTSGIIIFIVVMTLKGWDFTKLGDEKMSTKTYEISESFTEISVVTETTDIKLARSEDNTCRIVSVETDRDKVTAEVTDGVLTVTSKSNRKWYDFVSFGVLNTSITIYLPESAYKSLTFSSSTGDIEVPEFTFETMNLKASTGDIRLQSVTSEGAISIIVTTGDIKMNDTRCGSLSCACHTSDLHLNNVTANESLVIETSTGDIHLSDCDAAELKLKTSTGDVKGTLLSGKDFSATSSTGDIKVPESTSGGKCSISTSTGDIKISVK